MLSNGMARGRCDPMPGYVRKMKVWPLFVTRTWGGLVASNRGPTLMDGGYYTAPDAAVYGLDGKIELVANRVYLLTPADVEVSAEERERLAGRGFSHQFQAALVAAVQMASPRPCERGPRTPLSATAKSRAYPRVAGDE